MLSSAKIGRSSWRYYQDTVVAGACEYYSERGDAEGRWHGHGLAELGLVADGVVLERELEALFGRGLHPGTGEALGRAWRTDAVTGHDLTFSAPKSVSALWALASPATTSAVREAHTAAVHAALDYLQTHASYSRRGKDGVEQVATAGYAAALFDHTTSRAGDPQLHTHALVVNKVRCEDGAWRTIDGTEVFHHKKSAGVVYQAALRAELASRLGVAWGEVSEHGQAEIAGIPQELIGAWSKRTGAVMADAIPTIAEAEVTLGREVSRAERARIVKTAVLATRPEKDHDVTATDLMARWRRQADDLGCTPSRVQESVVAATHGRAVPVAVSRASVISSVATSQHESTPLVSVNSSVAGIDLRDSSVGVSVISSVVGRDAAGHSPGVSIVASSDGPAGPALTAERVLEWERAVQAHAVRRVGRGKAVWSRADLVAALGRYVPVGNAVAPRTAAEAVAWVERMTTAGLDTIEAGAVPLGPDPTGVTARASDARYASADTVRHEALIIEEAITFGFRDPAPIDPRRAELLWTGDNQRLSRLQRKAALRLATSLDLVTVLTAPAGAGKTTTLGAAAQLWRAQGREVFCLGPSARAAAELGAAVGAGRGRTVASWLTAQQATAPTSGEVQPAPGVRDGSVVIVDEASMLSTFDMLRLVHGVGLAGGHVVLVGDPAQIGTVNAAGGMFEHLTHVLAPRVIGLEELHRFTDPAEAAASLYLRAGDARVLPTYVDAQRIHPHASSADAADAVFARWHQVIESGRDALMLAQAWTDVTALNARARAASIATGQITGDPLLTITSRTASTRGHAEQRDWRAGDILLAKKNTPAIRIGGEPLRNGDRFRVLAATDDARGLLVQDLAGRGTTTLPIAYLARWSEYGWASTINGAQGATTDIAITLARSGLDREHLDVAMTRGRVANHIHTTPEISTGDAGPDHPHHPDAPVPGSVAGQGELPIPAPAAPDAPRPPAPGEMRDALELLGRAMATSGRERAAHALLNPAIAAKREEIFEVWEARRTPPPLSRGHQVNRRLLDDAHRAQATARDEVQLLTAHVEKDRGLVRDLPASARGLRAALIDLLDQHTGQLQIARSTLLAAGENVGRLTAVVDRDAGDAEDAANRDRDQRHDSWATHDQRHVTDHDPDQLHRQANLTPAPDPAPAPEPERYHYLDVDPYIEHSHGYGYGIDDPGW